jgi:hypothetical protein
VDAATFVNKWSKFAGKETSGYTSHFDDLCALMAHETPTAADPSASFFCFQRFVAQRDGRPGFADVFYSRHFGWEYKGNHKDLDAAYQQLLRYRENLESPPLLIVSDYRRIVVRTNFTNSITRTITIELDDLISGKPLPASPWTAMEVLHAVFFEPEMLNPSVTPVALTEGAARQFGRVADDLRETREARFDPVTRAHPRSYTDPQVAKFLTRMIFCMFASDVGLLPPNVVSQLIDSFRNNSIQLRDKFSELFRAMSHGGTFGAWNIPYFDGGLFGDDEALSISSQFVDDLRKADELDWSDIEPSIFGTLFERILDPDRRKQIGAHYTSREDIELIVRPVLMEPLDREWAQTVATAEKMRLPLGGSGAAERQKRTRALLQGFLDRLGRKRVLDPACGSGNFLYVSLALLKGLERQVLTAAAHWGVVDLQPSVHPRQLKGIELDPYAHELASVVVWIGYLQWKRKNGIPLDNETPVLEPFTNFLRMDAIVGRADSGRVFEPEWPEADVIVGNPPFLGGKRLRTALGDAEVDAMFEVWNGRVPREADLCCYWFEKARALVAAGKVKRAGLLATQAIRGGKNREVLKAIKRSGDVFFAVDDRAWVLDGAAVHVSMVGFDDGSETQRVLVRHRDGKELERLSVEGISADLTAKVADVTQARPLAENAGISYMGDTKAGPFEIDAVTAERMLEEANPDRRSNAAVVRRWVNGVDLTAQPRHMWIVDFPPGTTEEEAAKYEAPFEYVARTVRPARTGASGHASGTGDWWVHHRPRPTMRWALARLGRYLVTPNLTKFRFFVWLEPDILPDHQLIAFSRDDDYFLGVLQSRIHEAWSLRQGTQLREAESGFRYTPTTCFETFPLPWPPGHEPLGDARHAAVAAAAHELDRLRTGWLNPVNPDGSPWEGDVSKRTLTNLYNARPSWLADAHRRLDETVFSAYGWPDKPATVSDDEIVGRLLALNLARSAASGP